MRWAAAASTLARRMARIHLFAARSAGLAIGGSRSCGGPRCLQIKKAYRGLALKYHPDKNRTKPNIGWSAVGNAQPARGLPSVGAATLTAPAHYAPQFRITVSPPATPYTRTPQHGLGPRLDPASSLPVSSLRTSSLAANTLPSDLQYYCSTRSSRLITFSPTTKPRCVSRS